MKLTDDTSVRYHTKIDGRLGGPYTVEGLDSLVYLQRITPETLIGREGSDAFSPVKDTELCRVLFPKLQAAKASKAPHDWAPPGKENDPNFTNRKRYRFSESKFDNVNAKGAKRPKIEVHELLDEIRQTEIASGRDHVRSERFRISRRSRDFWVMIVLGNTVFMGTAICFGNTMSLVFGIAGCGLFTFGLLWSMYGVMGRY